MLGRKTGDTIDGGDDTINDSLNLSFDILFFKKIRNTELLSKLTTQPDCICFHDNLNIIHWINWPSKELSSFN